MSVKKYLKRVGRYLLKGLPVNHITANIVTIAPNELLKGRKALITGGTSGIGYAIASAFLRSGATVTITGRTEQRLKDSAKKLAEENPSAKDKISFVVMNNKEVSSFKTLFDCHPNLKGTDILVNNAGVLGGDISIATEEYYDSILDTNLKGIFFLSQLVARNMKERGIRGQHPEHSIVFKSTPGDICLYNLKMGNTWTNLGTSQSACSIRNNSQRPCAWPYGNANAYKRRDN